MCFSTSAARHLSMFTMFLAYLSLFFHTWPPWYSSFCMSPSVGQWPLPAQLQLPTHQDMSLGVLVGTLEQGGGTWQEAKPGHLAEAWQEQGVGPEKRQGLGSKAVENEGCRGAGVCHTLP